MSNYPIKVQLVTSYSEDRKHRLADVVYECIEAGIDSIQFSWPDDDPNWIYHAQKIRQLTHDAGIKFIVNNRVHFAEGLDADGVHIGPTDMAISSVKELVDPSCEIGYSIRNHIYLPEEADYYGVGPIFQSRTMKHVEPIGTDIINKIANYTNKPLHLIGGITPYSIQQTFHPQVESVSIIGSLYTSKNIRSTITNLKHNWEIQREKFFNLAGTS